MIYDEAYFTKAKNSPYIGYPKSNMGTDVAAQMVERANALAQVEKVGSTFLDWGCATGILVNELNKRGFVGSGIDFADWAVEHRVCEFVSKADALKIEEKDIPTCDFMHSSDFLEHLPPEEILPFLIKISKKCKRMYHYVPFYPDFSIPVDDGTGVHLTEVNADWWKKTFESIPGFRIDYFPDKDIGGYVVCTKE
jgi:hypothetical protein